MAEGFDTIVNGVTNVDELWRYARHLEAENERLHETLALQTEGAVRTCADNERLRALSQNNAKSWDTIVRERDALRAALKGIAEFCSGDDTTLGAISRLAHIRNTADRAVTGGQRGNET